MVKADEITYGTHEFGKLAARQALDSSAREDVQRQEMRGETLPRKLGYDEALTMTEAG